MNEYICLKCRRVFQVGASYAKCCGEVEEFSPEKHGELLIGSSNSWISVWEKWKSNPEFRKISDKLSEEGSYGAATAINSFIEELLENKVVHFLDVEKYYKDEDE
jgi:hypothetical protein